MGYANGIRRLGRYSLLKKIASGGMGEVYLARLDSVEGVERLFAIKLLLPQFVEDQSVVDMFITEARIAARINHSNVCQVFELGLENDELFICMEYLRGIPATSILDAHTPSDPFDPRIAVAIVKQAAAGLQFAHDLKDENGESLDVVHRDISPSNLFITSGGIAKVLDFGIVKARDSGVKTETGALKGNFAYMSPEQVRAHPLDSRSDIFSLGTVLFELLSNRRLFTGASQFEILRAIADSPIPTLKSVCPDLSPGLSVVLEGALSQDLAARYRTMREFSQGLTDAMRPLGGLADPGEVSDYIQAKFSSYLGDIDGMLRDLQRESFNEEEPAQVSPADEINSRAKANNDTNATKPHANTHANTKANVTKPHANTKANATKPHANTEDDAYANTKLVDQLVLSPSFTQLQESPQEDAEKTTVLGPPKDPFAPAAEKHVELEFSDGFVLESREGIATQEQDFIVKTQTNSETREPKNNTQIQNAITNYSWALYRVPVLVLLAWLTASHLWFNSKWNFINGVNSLLYEIGKYLFSWGGETMLFLGGPLGQLMVPIGLALYVGSKIHHRFAVAGCMWWLGQNVVHIARDMHDASNKGSFIGDPHDWAYFFIKWDITGQAHSIASYVRWLGIVVMLASLAYLIYLTNASKDNDVTVKSTVF